MLPLLRTVARGALAVVCVAGPTLVAVGSAGPAQAGTRTGTVRAAGGLNVRTGPSTSALAVGSLPDGARVAIACAVTGQRIVGTVRTSARWDRLTSGRYVSDAYVEATGAAPCADAPPAPREPTNAQFIAAAVPGAQRGWREFGVPASVTIAQAILESGWGRSELSAADRNFFGIKCFGDPGPIASGCRTYRTSECDRAGECHRTSASFRTYAQPADSFRDHGRFLRVNGRYRQAFAHSHDPDEFVRQVWLAGYATDPAYVAKVTGLMRSYDLYRYDIWR